MPTVTFRLYPPEFRWGDALPNDLGSAWFIKASSAGGTITYNTTTLRFIPLNMPALVAASAADEVSFQAPRSFVIERLWVLFPAAQGVGDSSSFAFNLNGVTQADVLTLGAGVAKAGMTLELPVPIDSLLCLECTATSGTPEQIRAIGVSWREAPGTDIA